VKIVWQCPNCMKMVSHLLYMSVYFDYGCSECKCPMRAFKATPIVEAVHKRMRSEP